MEEGFVSAIIERWEEGAEEARREGLARNLDYDSDFVEDFNFSPREFYFLLAKNLEKRRIPGIEGELVGLRESVAGSAKRVYFYVARERLAHYVCAAPFGSGFFFSWRYVDERMPGKWYHVVAGLVILALFGAAISAVLLLSFAGVIRGPGPPNPGDPGAAWLIRTALYGPFLLLLTAAWSLMRLAALPGGERLAKFVERQFVFGRIFERFYRPDTYYRQDTAKMHERAFANAVRETIEAVKSPKGVRQVDIVGAPLVSDLHGK